MERDIRPFTLLVCAVGGTTLLPLLLVSIVIGNLKLGVLALLGLLVLVGIWLFERHLWRKAEAQLRVQPIVEANEPRHWLESS